MMRPRPAVGLLLAASLALAGSVLAGAGAAAAAATATGRYTPIDPVRMLDTRQGTGVTEQVVASGDTVSVNLPDAVPSGATSVVLNVTATDTTGSGYVIAYSGGSRPLVSNLNYSKAATVANLTTVTLPDGARSVSFYNQGAAVDLLADVQGYVTAGSAGLGAYAPVSPTRLLDTRIGTGAAKAPVASGAMLTFTVTGGSAAIPTDASAVLVNLTVVTPKASGYLSAYPAGNARPTASVVNFSAGRNLAGLALVPVGNHGRITLYNGSAGTVDLLADVQGFVAGGSPTSVGAIGALAPQRLLDTRTTSPVASGKQVTVPTSGRGGVPTANVSAVVLTVTAVTPSASGYLTVWAGGQRPITSNLNFAKGVTQANLVVVRPDSSGNVVIYNGSGGTVQLLVDVAGYVLNTDVTVPATTTSRYLSDLTENVSDDETLMDAHGCSDAGAAPGLVLLDIGAQSRTGPELSATNPGVALALTRSSTTVRLTYAQLVTVLNSYLAGFARCAPSGTSTRVALGTSTSGAFTGATAYPANARGVEWAVKVVNTVATHAGITVVGANDIEAGFAGAESDAESWIQNYLSHTSADLVYNGSLDNCSDGYSGTMTCAEVTDENGVAKTWTPTQYVRLTYGLGAGRISVLPQIYFSNAPDQAAQWRNLYVQTGKKLTFDGSLTQYAVCGSVTCGFNGAQGWSALYHALSTVVAAPNLPVATDLARP